MTMMLADMASGRQGAGLDAGRRQQAGPADNAAIQAILDEETERQIKRRDNQLEHGRSVKPMFEPQVGTRAERTRLDWPDLCVLVLILWFVLCPARCSLCLHEVVLSPCFHSFVVPCVKHVQRYNAARMAQRSRCLKALLTTRYLLLRYLIIGTRKVSTEY